MSDSNKLDETASRLTNKVTDNSRVQRILSMDVQWVDRAITIFLFLLVIVLLYETRHYSWAAQRAPVFVLGMLLFLLLIELLLEFELVGSRDYEERQENVEEKIREQSDVEERPLLTRRVQILKTIVWIGILFGLVYILGLLPGSLVFLFVFYAAEAQVGLVRSVVYSAVIFVFVWVVFEVLLKARLYPGIFELGEIFYVSGSLF